LAHRANFRAKSTVFAENEPSVAVYMLTHGTARLYKMLGDGRRQIVGFALLGDFSDCPSLAATLVPQRTLAMKPRLICRKADREPSASVI
jgi:hypothetical protein